MFPLATLKVGEPALVGLGDAGERSDVFGILRDSNDQAFDLFALFDGLGVLELNTLRECFVPLR
jgi:hypothetical protein